MRAVLLILLALLLPIAPAAANQAGQPVTAEAEAPASRLRMPDIGVTAAHAAALGAGLFVGAVAGTALIHGGALAALIGAVAGVTVTHWYWTEARPDRP